MRRATIGAISGVLIGLVIAVVGGGFALAGWTARADIAPPDNGISTTAEIVGSVEGTALIDGIVVPRFSPVYEYLDVAGRPHRVTDHLSADARPPAVGSTVEISYRPGEPESVRRTDVDDGWLRWFVIGGVATAAIGALVMVLSLIGGSITIGRSPRDPRIHVRAERGGV